MPKKSKPKICPTCKRPLVPEMQSQGGKARAQSLTAEQRSEAARKAAAARWSKKPDSTKPKP